MLFRFSEVREAEDIGGGRADCTIALLLADLSTEITTDINHFSVLSPANDHHLLLFLSLI